MRKNWHKAIVTRKEMITDTITAIYLKSTERNVIDFIPGQFITLDLPIAETCIKRWRSYSIASAPTDMNEEYDYELCISKYQSGDGSIYLCDNVHVGDELKYKGPAGNFTLRYDEDSIIFMICSETGIAPFRSMLRALDNRQDQPHKIELIHITESNEQLIYKDEMCKFMNRKNHFRYSAIVTGDKYWLGSKNNILSDVIETHKNKGKKMRFYICGWPEMVKNMIRLLSHEMNYDKRQIFYQIYR